MIVGDLTRKIPLEENLKILKEIGYDGFQLDLCYFVDSLEKRLERRFLIEEKDDAHVKEVKALSDKLKFPVLAMHTFFPITEDKNLITNTFEKHLEYLKTLNCKYLILHISGYTDDKAKLHRAIDILKEVKPLYEKEGHEILLENDHSPSLFITIDDIKGITKETNLNLCMDTSHAMQSNVNLDVFYNNFKDKIKAIHFSDYKDGKPHKEIGTGILKQFDCYKEIIKLNKPLILEVGKDIKNAKSKEEIIKIYKNSFLEVKN